MNSSKLGTIEATEGILKDLFIDLRQNTLKWSKITHQTSQVRMGYVGQHLVSAVTGFKGGKSGARGSDLVLPDNKSAEIKSCNRVDQLGFCKDCEERVSSTEPSCPVCSSSNIIRPEDSKWLLSFKTDLDFINALKPIYYYFVLFEYKDVNDIGNNDIDISIWKIDTANSKGFLRALVDYYYTIRKNSSSAPFNLWPYSFKFILCEPELIYKAEIVNDNINTIVFPTLNNTISEKLRTLESYKSATTLTKDSILKTIKFFDSQNTILNKKVNSINKIKLLKELESIRVANDISNSQLVDVLSYYVYIPRLQQNNINLKKVPKGFQACLVAPS